MTSSLCMQIVAVRSLCSAVLTAGSISRMRASGNPVRYLGERSNFWLLLARGVFGAIGFTLYYFSIEMLPLPDAVVIFFTNVVITALMSVIGRYEKGTWQMFVGCTTCIGTQQFQSGMAAARDVPEHALHHDVQLRARCLQSAHRMCTNVTALYRGSAGLLRLRSDYFQDIIDWAWVSVQSALRC